MLRAARAADAPFIAELAERAFAEYDSHASRNVLRMLRSAAFAIVADDGDDRPVGFAIVSAEREASVSHLAAIAVHEDWRGVGVGRRLLDATLASAGSRGFRTLELTTADFNLAALELFRRAGFGIVRRVPRHYRTGADAVHMSVAVRTR